MAKKPDNLAGVVKLVKAGMTLPQVARELKVPASHVSAMFYAAEVEADPSLKFKATPASVVKARDKEGLRWERIAVRSGIGVAQAKALYETGGGNVATSYTGRGRKPASMAGKASPAASKKASGAKGGSKGSAKGGSKAPAKARTRAERLAKQGKANPS